MSDQPQAEAPVVRIGSSPDKTVVGRKLELAQPVPSVAAARAMS